MDPNAKSTLDLIANTLVISMLMLAMSRFSFREEGRRIARRALVVCSMVLQASCVGIVWLYGGRGTLSLVLLVVSVAALLWLVVDGIRRDPLWRKLKR